MGKSPYPDKVRNRTCKASDGNVQTHISVRRFLYCPTTRAGLCPKATRFGVFLFLRKDKDFIKEK
jgi:hypothetical protein